MKASFTDINTDTDASIKFYFSISMDKMSYYSYWILQYNWNFKLILFMIN